MASKSRRNTLDADSAEEDNVQNLQGGENTKSRSKNFTDKEITVLLSACDKFYSVINKNSNREVDKMAKASSWLKIKTGFDNYCKTQGCYVENRTVEQLQTKYKALKKQARTISASVKRDLARTGNEPLAASTTKALQKDSALLSLRARMGAAASGFQSKHCSDARQVSSSQTDLLSQLDVNAEPPSRTLEITAEDSDAQMIEDAPSTRSVRYGKRTTKRAMSAIDSNRASAVNQKKSKKKIAAKSTGTETIETATIEAETTEHGEPLYGQGSGYKPRPIRARKRRSIPGSVDSQTLVIGNPETDTSNDISDPAESEYDHSSASDNARHQRSNNAQVQSVESSGHLSYEEALNALRCENDQYQAEIDWNDFMNSDDEFPIDRQLRLAREAEESERPPTGRLTAPPSELRSRRRPAPPPAKANNNDITTQLRVKQMELVEEQLKLQRLLVSNAQIAQEEAKERLKLVTAQRKMAEIELRGKEADE